MLGKPVAYRRAAPATAFTILAAGASIFAGRHRHERFSYVINLGGGTVGAEASWSSSLNMNLTGSNGPVTFNSGGQNNNACRASFPASGGLIVAGSGTLDLSGANTYKGDTTVNAGTLKLDLAGSSPAAFRLTNGASLNLNFAGTYVVAACYTNGVVLPNGVYTSSNLPGLITGSGLLQVVGPVSTGLWTGGGVNNNWSAAGNWNQQCGADFPHRANLRWQHAADEQQRPLKHHGEQPHFRCRCWSLRAEREWHHE